jgi:hypothetical protein
MSNAVVIQIHQLPQLPQPAHSPLYKCQRHQQECRSYNITIPNILNASSSSDDDDNGYSSPHPEVTSFVSIDGDYDDEETPNVAECGMVIGAGVCLSVATAPPLDDDYIVTCENKPNSTLQTQKQEQEEEVCIICYDKIEEKHGNFYTNFCDTCKYTVHIPCIEEYIIRKLKDDVQITQSRVVGIKCLLCSKVVESGELTQEEFEEINNSGNGMNRNRITAEQRRDIELHEHALRIMERQIRRSRRNNNKRFLCQVCFIICLILCAGGVLVAVIKKNT